MKRIFYALVMVGSTGFLCGAANQNVPGQRVQGLPAYMQMLTQVMDERDGEFIAGNESCCDLPNQTMLVVGPYAGAKIGWFTDELNARAKVRSAAETKQIQYDIFQTAAERQSDLLYLLCSNDDYLMHMHTVEGYVVKTDSEVVRLNPEGISPIHLKHDPSHTALVFTNNVFQPKKLAKAIGAAIAAGKDMPSAFLALHADMIAFAVALDIQKWRAQLNVPVGDETETDVVAADDIAPQTEAQLPAPATIAVTDQMANQGNCSMQ